MMETNENAVLDLRFAAVEQPPESAQLTQVLQAVQQHSQEDYTKQILESKSTALLYHLSPLRENIAAWYPFKDDAAILELDAECGAVTGALAPHASRLDCVEPSLQKSAINALRHRQTENFCIHVGDFTKEMFDDGAAFDYIVLFGSAAFGKGLSESHDPQAALLKELKTLLKPNGKILLAVANRLGLKYWAGAKETASGVLFRGIEGYEEEDEAVTFSKARLEAIFQEADLRYQFYYPYPDHCFPMAVYSDEYLPHEGELNKNNRSGADGNLVLFDEEKAFNALLKEENFAAFANSFFVELSGE